MDSTVSGNKLKNEVEKLSGKAKETAGKLSGNRSRETGARQSRRRPT